MTPRPLLLAAALVATAACVSNDAEAALPIGLDAGLGLGARGAFEGRDPTFDMRVNVDLRLGVVTLGGEFRDQPPLFRDDGINYALGYFNLGLNLPLPKARIALRAGIGGGSDNTGIARLGVHESIALHIFPKGPLGFGFGVDFDQNFDVEDWSTDSGMSGGVGLLLRI